MPPAQAATSYSISLASSLPPPSDIGSYSRSMHQHTKRQMEQIEAAASGVPPSSSSSLSASSSVRSSTQQRRSQAGSGGGGGGGGGFPALPNGASGISRGSRSPSSDS